MGSSMGQVCSEMASENILENAVVEAKMEEAVSCTAENSWAGAENEQALLMS